MDLSGTRILVTGGGRGLGRRFVLDLLDAGARVGTCDVDETALDELAQLCRKQGRELWTNTCNVADEAEVESLFRDFVAALGGIDAVVNNAGITRDGLLVRKKGDQLQKLSLDKWQSVIDVNLTGVFLCAREAAYHMIQMETPGLIVSISSISRHGNMGQTNYTATKAAVAAMTVVWSKELAPHGIRAVAIAPGYTSTEMTEAIREDVKAKIIGTIPAGRMADMGEISQALRFVLENDYVNGRVIEVDGGLRI